MVLSFVHENHYGTRTLCTMEIAQIDYYRDNDSKMVIFLDTFKRPYTCIGVDLADYNLAYGNMMQGKPGDLTKYVFMRSNDLKERSVANDLRNDD